MPTTISRAVLDEQQRLAVDAFARVIDQDPPKNRTMMINAFKDGMRTMVLRLEAGGIVKVEG